MQDLGTLGGSDSFAECMNASGQVVGRAHDTSDVLRPFLWENGTMQDLGTLGGSSAKAWGINGLGSVVGTAYTADEKSHAFLWENGVMYDLNDFLPDDSGWVLQSALAINDLGQIVGGGVHDGHVRSFLLTPIPEPSTLGVLGLTLLVAMRRLRRG